MIACRSYEIPARESAQLQRLAQVDEVVLDGPDGPIEVDADTSLTIELVDGRTFALSPSEMAFGRTRLRLGDTSTAPVVPYGAVRVIYAGNTDSWALAPILGCLGMIPVVALFATIIPSYE